MNERIGDTFYQGTKYKRGKLPGHRLDWSKKPVVFKEYTESQRISLPESQTQDGPRLWEVLTKRRSKRAYTKESISLKQLSQILWATQGITARVSGHALRTAPSAGALYPIETYLWVNRVSTVEQGLYHYAVYNHSLELLKKGDFSKEVSRGALDQRIAGDAAVTFIWSAIIERSRWKYLQRAYRYIFMDVGHIAQNLALAAEALELGSCQIGALYDDEMNALLNLDGIEESVIYMSSVAHSKH